MNDKNNGRRPVLRSLLIMLVVATVYAYAVQVTQINLEEPLEPRRQENLFTLVRELARPDIFSFQNETRSTNASIRMPCPEDVKGSQVTNEGRVVLLTPNCATTTQDPLTMSGEGFPANIRGAVLWHPTGAATPRRLTEFRTDDAGTFQVQFTMPDIRETDAPQRIEVVEVLSRRLTGWSEASLTTFERILETILMALMASTIGTILAVPLSFLAARNLMADVGMPLAALMAALVVIPIAGWIGGIVAGWLVGLSVQVSSQTVMGVGAFVAATALTWPVLRFGPPVFSDEKRPLGAMLLSGLRLLLVLLLVVFSLGTLAQLGLTVGAWLREVLGFWGFVGNFIAVASELVYLLLPVLVGAVAALTAASFGSRYGQEAILRLPTAPARLFTLVLTVLGTAILVWGILYGANWICLLGMCNQLSQNSIITTLAVPAVVLGGVAGLFSLGVQPKRPFPIGMTIYTLIRGTLNMLRAIEPLIMGIVFVVWVGLGPFAGILALTLHSIADLGKLFSEQVENIAEGPLEAITATGANRLQTVVYAVIPQIIPHYIAFTFYRWDINVRLSTIIGFVGGGGIGFVLQRHANLTQYREASVMVIAIAVVVFILDNVSSRLRRRII